MAGHPTARLRFPRKGRLKQTRDFLRLKSEGHRQARGCLVANWSRSTPGHASRLGIVTSRRIGSAVVRNRARRLLREAFRLHQHQLTHPLDLVLIARPSIVGRTLQEVEMDLLSVLGRHGLLQSA